MGAPQYVIIRLGRVLLIVVDQPWLWQRQSNWHGSLSHAQPAGHTHTQPNVFKTVCRVTAVTAAAAALLVHSHLLLTWIT